MTRKALARRIAEVLFNEPATLTQHFVLGYFRQVPAGRIFSSPQTTCAILIVTPKVDAHGRPPEPLPKKTLWNIRSHANLEIRQLLKSQHYSN